MPKERFFQQYFYPKAESLSVVIEDNGIVAYAYFYEKGRIVGDVWLYNCLLAPESSQWPDPALLPFLNPARYLKESCRIEPISSKKDVAVEWHDLQSAQEVYACIHVRGELIGCVSNKSKPGWSALVKESGPLARIMDLGNQDRPWLKSPN